MTDFDFNYGVQDGIATVRLDRPQKLNSLTFKTYENLERLTRELAREDAVKVVVITGEGKGFCSGGDVEEIIGELLKMGPEGHRHFTRLSCDLIRNMRNLNKPILAAVNGMAAGGGAMLALGSDLRILSERARFAFLFVRVGLAGSDMGALYLLPRIVGQGKAAELLLLGDTIDAHEARRIGLANRVVPHDNLMQETYELASRLKNGPHHAMAVTKELLRLEADLGLEAALDMEAAAQARCMQTPDFKEGYQAFVEKRPPRFNR
ncbi:MAG TPA: enoyl-CoA hydratase family protein [Candidatus Binatia bacterium]